MTTKAKEQDVISTESMIVRIGSLHQDRKRFLNYPPFQREKVWSLRMKQAFIDSILRKLPVNSCMLMEDENESGEGIYQVIDGQQRLESIFDFLENHFSTMTDQQAKGGFLTLEPVEPGSTFSELPQAVQNRFLDYKMPFVTFPQEHESILEEIYLRTNNQEPLSVGEQLFIRDCKARHMSLALLQHSFWQNVYTGRTLRKENFQAALEVIAIEALGFPLVLHISHQGLAPLNKLVLGELDDMLTDTLQNTIYTRLTAAEKTFKGASVHSKRDVIPVYQACVLLDEKGFDVQASEQGCLVNWFILAKRGSNVDRVKDYRPFARIDFLHAQRAFWDIETENIQRVTGLARKKK